MTAEERQARLLKIQRLRTGVTPRVLELCSGCGGLSLGLKSAGFQLTAHVEKDPEAAKSYALNFAADGSIAAEWAMSRDMEKCSPGELVKNLGIDSPTSGAFDIVAAGLPCQAFARIGRSKLRAVSGGKEDAFRKDARASLYVRFLEYVADTQPLAIVIENVPDILNFGGHNVPEEICETLESMGYTAAYTLLNSAFYGVPQVRERFFLIAVADDLNLEPTFPEPTHYLDLPKGYEGSRQVALKYVPADSPRFRQIHIPSDALESAVPAIDALGDLPEITEHWTDRHTMRRRRVADRLPYRTNRGLSAYARLMREWAGFALSPDVDGHVVRITPRDFPIFAKMPPGADYPRARAIAEDMFLAELASRGWMERDPSSPEVMELRKKVVPPYDPKKFPNKWWKLDPAKPSRTLTAHMGKDTYSHIHYDSEQQRTVSVREAARLQSFPDSFRFAGAMNAAFRQIGNAVPPLLGKAVAMSLKEQIESALASSDQLQEQQAA
jgi:DNA (cytosine-5)-methyltransferase 1